MKNHEAPLHAQAQLKLSPERLDKEIELFPSSEIVWERIKCLASLARAINPDFGQNLRFVKRAPLDTDERNAVSFDIFLTHSSERELSYKDSQGRIHSSKVKDRDISLEQALRQVLPAEVVDHEMGLIRNAPAHGFASGADAAIQNAFIKGHISLNTKIMKEAGETGEELRDVWVTSGPYAISDTQFMTHANVARWVWMAPDARESADNDRIPSAVNSIRRDVLRLRELLNKSFAHSSKEDKAEVVERIARLNSNRNARPSFEEVFDHSWVGYSLARRNGEGWTKFLTEKAHCDPNGHYAGQTPLVIALAQDDASSLKVLMGKGLSANLLLSEFPALYDYKIQRQLNDREERVISLLMYTTVIGAKKCAEALLENGAEPNFLTDQGSSPLHEAAYKGDFAMVRLLKEKGADFLLKNNEGLTADKYVPEGKDYNSLYEFIEKTIEKTIEEAKEEQMEILKKALNARRTTTDNGKTVCTVIKSPSPMN